MLNWHRDVKLGIDSDENDLEDFVKIEIIGRRVDLPPDAHELISCAFHFALKAHGKGEDGKPQRRKSGELYIVHPLEVAKIASDGGADADTIAAAMLHDVLEDCKDSVDINDLITKFGENIAAIVETVSDDKFLTANQKLQLAQIRQDSTALAAMIIRLCDRIHNLRTMDVMPEKKRRKKAEETVRIHMAMARIAGLWKFEIELADLALRYLEADDYQEIVQNLNDPDRIKRNRDLVQAVREKLTPAIEQRNISDYSISARPESPYFDVWRRKHGRYNDSRKRGPRYEYQESYDTCWMLLLTGTEEECRALNELIAEKFVYDPKRDKDYFKRHKDNYYRALHRTVSFNGVTVKFQIRTWKSNEGADYGILAHTRYTTYSEKEARDTKMYPEYNEEAYKTENFYQSVMDKNPY